MWTNKWSVVLLVVVGLTACSKKTDIIQPPPPTQPVAGKLAKISFDSGAYDSLYYAPSGNLIKVKSVFDPANGVSVIIYSFDYNAQGKLTRIYNDQGVEYRYTYSGDQLDEVGVYISGLKTSHKGFTYNADGVLTATATFSDLLSNPGDQDFLDMFLYTYYPDGNLKTETSFSVDPTTGHPVKEVSITHSDYDNNHNPDDIFKQLPYFFGIKFSKNNARTRILKNEKTGVESTYLFTYTYNQATLPLTRKFEYYGSGNWEEGTCTYSYY
jgi:hypothetical protein